MTDNKSVVIELLPSTVTSTSTITNYDVRHVVLVIVIEIRIHSVSFKINPAPRGDMLAMSVSLLSLAFVTVY